MKRIKKGSRNQLGKFDENELHSDRFKVPNNFDVLTNQDGAVEAPLTSKSKIFIQPAKPFTNVLMAS